MTAWVTFSPRYASAASFSFLRIMAETSGGEYCLPRTSMRASPLVALTTLYGTSLISWSTSSWRRPMNRLIENTVFSGFVIACRLATCPTRISPSFVNPATEGVSRLPSWFAITVGLPPSTTATTELVVPRSMPITFAMSNPPSPWSFYGNGAGRSAQSRHSTQLDRLDDVDLDRFWPSRSPRRKRHLEHPIAVRRLHLVRLHGHRQLHAAFELPVDALDAIHVLVLDVSVGCALPLQG